MRRLTVVVVVLGAALSHACGGTPSATEVLSATAGSLGDIHSGELHVRVEVATAPGEGAASFGFDLKGEFDLSSDTRLPVADIAYSQFTEDDASSAALVSTGESAYVTIEGETVEMNDDQLAVLASAGGSVGSAGLDELDVGGWIDDPELTDGGRRGGVDTYLVTGRLDVAEALNGMVGAAQGFGATGAAGLQRLEDADVDLLNDVVGSSSVKVYSGKDDELLRELDLEVEFQAAGDKRLVQALGPLSGATLSLLVSVDEPNSEVTVEPPSGV